MNNDERFEWGAVDYNSWVLYREGGSYEPGAAHCHNFRTFHGVGATCLRFTDFEKWMLETQGDGYLKMISDNVAYDWQFINHYLHRFLGSNVLGHSARRIGGFAAGLERNFWAPQKWKNLRITKHDHHPVHDALGNVEAYYALVKPL